MGLTLSVGIDLGCDALKISYAYSEGTGKISYGKLACGNGVGQAGIPAVAYYDGAEWSFGFRVDSGEEKQFVNVVKIKSLLSLLYAEREEGQQLGATENYPDRNYYYKGENFPKFYFPNSVRTLRGFGDLIKTDRTFIAAGYTPQAVCRLFFDYVAEIVKQAIAGLKKRTGLDFTKIQYALVHPSHVGKEFIKELTGLATLSFGKAPVKVMDSARALSMFAMQRGEVGGDEGILIFDMGEETVSVSKCFLNKQKKVVIEAAADHSMPVSIGGNDVDFAIAEFIEKSIYRRETVGSPSYGDVNHVFEEGLQSKQYLFLKEIKRAKTLLGVRSLNALFKQGVPVSVHRDLYVQRTLTHGELANCLGVTNNSAVAHKILQYIVNECELPVNDDVKNVFLTGGLVETYGLVEYLRKQMKVFAPKFEIKTFDDGVTDGDPFTIQSYEDSVYAPAVGAAIVANKNYDVRAGLTYSYGTWIQVGVFERGADGKPIRGKIASKKPKVLAIFADRGTAYDDNKPAEFLTDKFAISTSIQNDEFFCVRLSKSSIDARKCEGEVEYVTSVAGEVYLLIDEKNSAARKKAEKKFQLRSLAGDNMSLECEYKGKKVMGIGVGTPTARIPAKEGIIVRPRSKNVEPCVKNLAAEDPGEDVTVELVLEGDVKVKTKASAVTLYLKGVKGFGVVKG